jgi:hypothetical protein
MLGENDLLDTSNVFETRTCAAPESRPVDDISFEEIRVMFVEGTSKSRSICFTVTISRAGFAAPPLWEVIIALIIVWLFS